MQRVSETELRTRAELLTVSDQNLVIRHPQAVKRALQYFLAFPVTAYRDVGETCFAYSALEEAIGNQPDLGDGRGHLPANVARIVGFQVALLAQPLAQFAGI